MQGREESRRGVPLTPNSREGREGHTGGEWTSGEKRLAGISEVLVGQRPRLGGQLEGVDVPQCEVGLGDGIEGEREDAPDDARPLDPRGAAVLAVAVAVGHHRRGSGCGARSRNRAAAGMVGGASAAAGAGGAGRGEPVAGGQGIMDAVEAELAPVHS
eukprot:scaffold27458_cov50-Phaeocystis_antarctica.AAC.2